MNYAFVASTLPFLKIKELHASQKIDVIICASRSLQSSYMKVIGVIDKNIKVVGPVESKYLFNFQLAYYLLIADRIFIFHECCWRNFDILIKLLGKKEEYYPTVTLTSRRKIKKINEFLESFRFVIV